MATVFDGDNLLITLDAPTNGVLQLDIQVDLYSDWKEWMLSSFQNQGYPQAFRTAAGDAISDTNTSVPYFFLRNDLGWRIRPFEADQTINIIGQLSAQDQALPMTIPTIAGHTVIGFNVQAVAQTVLSGVVLAPSEKQEIIDGIYERVIEGGYTFEEIMRLLGAVAAGDVEQDVDGSYTIRGLDGTTARVLGELASNNGRDITALNAA